MVVDATGAPVAGAEVLASSGGARYSTTSGSDGSFALLGLDHDRHQLIAREGDRAATWRVVDLHHDNVTDLKLVLADAMMSGIVVDEAGTPVAGVEVGAFPSPPNIFLLEDRIALTDASGRWTVGPLAAPTYRLFAGWPGSKRSSWNLPDDAPDHAPGHRDVRLVLEAGATIRGVVTRGGAPVRRPAPKGAAPSSRPWSPPTTATSRSITCAPVASSWSSPAPTSRG